MRIQSQWSTFTGAPGYTNFHFDGTTANGTTANAAAAAVRTFWDSIKVYLPNGLTISNRSFAEVFATDGPKTAEVAISTPGAAIVGASVAAYAGGTGCVVNWRTGLYISGRQLIGKTYVVPFAGGYATDGTLTPAAVLAVQNAANVLRATVNPYFGVWSPRPAPALSNFANVTTALVPDRAATLRSRR
jgi:hypothetical protein